jgi:hypothetical protein
MRCLVRVLRSATVCIALLTHAQPALGQEGNANTKSFSSARWCQDSGTYCWTDPAKSKWFNGVRIIGEVDLGWLMQGGGNRFANKGFSGLTKVGLEFNIYGAHVSAQTVLIAPGSIELDDKSPLVTERRLPNGNRHIDVDWGFAGGLSFFDGSISSGFGRLFYDRRDIRPNATGRVARGDVRDSYGYVSFQPVSGLRAVVKGGKGN